MLPFRICLCSIIAGAFSLAMGGGPSYRLDPRVMEMAVPSYPPAAKLANIDGVAHFLVQTDGSVIKDVLTSDGPPLLVRELGKYLKTWKFEPHDPVQIEITFVMKIGGLAICPPGKPDEIKLILPSYLEMTCTRTKECDPIVFAEGIPSDTATGVGGKSRTPVALSSGFFFLGSLPLASLGHHREVSADGPLVCVSWRNECERQNGCTLDKYPQPLP